MLKLHIGCGKRYFGPEWDHIDAASFPHIKWTDIYCSNYEPNSVDVIYASHLIAYFDREEIVPLLQAWHKVLKVGGVLRLATPDFYTLARLRLDLNNDVDLSKILGPLYGRMVINDKAIYHRTVYDNQSLSKLLTETGFKDIRRYDFKTTDHSQFDDHSMAVLDGYRISLNVECNK